MDQHEIAKDVMDPIQYYMRPSKYMHASCLVMVADFFLSNIYTYTVMRETVRKFKQ